MGYIALVSGKSNLLTISILLCRVISSWPCAIISLLGSELHAVAPVCVCVCVYGYVYMYVYVCVWMCVYVCVYVYGCVYMYVYVYACMYTHTEKENGVVNEAVRLALFSLTPSPPPLPSHIHKAHRCAKCIICYQTVGRACDTHLWSALFNC